MDSYRPMQRRRDDQSLSPPRRERDVRNINWRDRQSSSSRSTSPPKDEEDGSPNWRGQRSDSSESSGNRFPRRNAPSGPRTRNNSGSGRLNGYTNNSWRNQRNQHDAPRRDSGDFVNADDVVPGLILQLPQPLLRGCIFRESRELRRQPHVNEHAGGHPTIVWDTYVRHDGEKIARCLQVTSFSCQGEEGQYHQTVEEKYSRGGGAWKVQVQYLPIDHDARSSSRTNQPILKLAGGRNMDHQSYAHLDHFFEIEARLLKHMPGGGPDRRLIEDSLCVVVWKLRQFFDDTICRRQWHPDSRFPKSPLDEGGCGKPRDLSESVRRLEARGARIERERLASTGTRLITGYENFLPSIYAR